MRALQWLLGILQILVLSHQTNAIYFFDDETRRSDIVDHVDFFKSVEEDLKATSRSNIMSMSSGKLSFGSFCSMNVEVAGSKVTATADKSGGCSPPSIKMVLDSQFAGNNLKATLKVIDGEFFEVESIEVDKSANSITLKTNARAQHLPILFFLYLNMGGFDSPPTAMDITWPSTETMTLTNLDIKITGAAALGSWKAETEIVKPSGKTLFEIVKLDTKSAQIQVFELAKKFAVYPPGLAREEDNFKYGSVGSLTWRDMIGYGAFNINDEFQLIFEHQTKEGHTQPFGFAGIWMKLIISRFNNAKNEPQPIFGTFMVKMPSNKNMLEVVTPLLTFPNLRALPMLRRFADRDWCIMISAKGGKFMDTAKIKTAMKFCFPEGNKQEIKPGFNLKIQVKLAETLRDDCQATEEQIAALPKIAALDAAMTQQAVKFSFPAEYSTPLKATIKCMGAEALSDIPFNLFNEDGKEPLLQIQEFSFTPRNEKIEGSRMYFRVTFVLTLPKKYRTIPNTNVGFGPFKMHVQTNKAKPGWDIIALTTVTLSSGVSAHVQLGKMLGAPDWKFVLQVPSLTFQQIKEIFTDNLKTKSTGVTALDGWGIKNFALEYTFGKSTILKIRGNPLLFGYDGAHLEGMYWKPATPGPVYVDNPNTGEKQLADQPKNAFAFAVWFKKINLDWILEKIMGTNKPSVKWFSNMNAVIAISNAVGVVKGKDAYKKVEKEPTESEARMEIPEMNEEVNGLRYRRNAATNSFSIKNKIRQYLQKGHYGTRRNTSPAFQSAKRETEKVKVPAEPEIVFTIPGLAATAIRPGLSFLLTYKLPMLTRDCFESAMCKWMVKNLGQGFHIQLLGYIGKKGVEITAKIGFDIELIAPKKLMLTNVIFRLRIGLNDPGIRVEARMAYNNADLTDDTLTFMGAIEIGFTGKLVLEFAMGGMIKRPWDNDYIAFGNIFLSAGYSFGAVPLPSFQFAVEVWLGKLIANDPNNNKHVIKFKGAFGIDPNKPQDFWVYAKFNKLSIKGVCEAYQLKCDSIPASVAESGFPEGLTLSYAKAAKSIPTIGLFVPAGFFISGKIKIFDIEAWGKIIVQPETSTFEVDIKMAPINWVNGLIKVQRNDENSKEGPICFIRASKTYFRVNIEGYAEVLGINGLVKIEVSETKFEFRVKGTMWPGIFDAGVHLIATYGNLNTMSFAITVDVETSKFMVKLKQAIIDFCDSAGKAAKAAFERADAAFAKANNDVLEADKKVKKWRNDISAWQERLRARNRELEKKKKAMNTSCKSKCPKVCFGFLEWNSRCWKIWGHWCGCPRWNSCYSKIDDIICLAGCELSKLAKKFMIWVEQVGIKIQLALGDVAKGLADMASGILSAARSVLSFAQDVKNFVGTAVQGALKGLKWLVEKAANIFWLNKLQLKASLDQDFNACVGYDIDCKLFGFVVKSKGEACLSGKFLKSLVNGVTDSKDSPSELKGISKTSQKLEEAEGKFDSIKDAETKLEKDKKDADSKISKEVAKNYDEEMSRRSSIPRPEMLALLEKLPKRTTVPTEEEMKYIQAANEPLPEYIKSEETVSAFNSAPWFTHKDISPAGLDSLPIKDKTETGSKRELDFESAMSPCERMRRALKSYSDLADGLLSSSQSLAEQSDNYKKDKIHDQNRILKLQEDINHLESHHNLTDQDRKDAYFWYNKVNKGFEDFTSRSEIALAKQESYAIPIIRRQLNHMLMKEKGSTFNDFTDLMHYNAMKGYKRSSIPTPRDVNVEKKLIAIKRDLVSIVTSDEQSLGDMNEKLHDVRGNIRSVISYTNHCRSA
ncbi:uncharacterized protein LOC130624945 [Hydractinia symbiolongicarpus]|uniref:uncharacterized protein LOC130624945 n=1 Tax=Hydractinia symbiolongicarpus TaxID=13093 RepID=UPI00254A9785|nr:uncharacterized protein LOC130624945 [Hydractinia symbiolongicarpus]XP_057295990.1 uncharacterized protein LOC130624945 [Hydractinia symbiolongicarpus]